VVNDGGLELRGRRLAFDDAPSRGRWAREPALLSPAAQKHYSRHMRIV
jgi:hypothetical protein